MTVTVTVTALLTTAQLLLLVTGTLSDGSSCGLRSSGLEQGSNITLTVINNMPNTNQINLTYSARTAFRGSLLGAMRGLQEADCSFTFTTTENINYGPYLESVNGVVGKTCDRTYWELLSQHANGTIISLDVGIGCYIPNPNERIILKFTKW
ncbi:transcobalamin-1-like [Anguilla anguilla]|uniref:DUF4430 domain-containing protein n=1 Tax=Anguilla anguilla TaxID=7936 RepID=A0A9D3LXX1_ANGAN|nr:transcobalamin-1-like [Anguilla anguilla]KAG5836928.1 hypothetical protein ANANG_G00233870 [Anguilla anguilla]